jgi:hypothetical protein
MGRAEAGAGHGAGTGQQARCRNFADHELDDLCERVCRWAGEHPDGTDEQILAEFAPAYAGYDPGELAIVLHAALFMEQWERQR